MGNTSIKCLRTNRTRNWDMKMRLNHTGADLLSSWNATRRFGSNHHRFWWEYIELCKLPLLLAERVGTSAFHTRRARVRSRRMPLAEAVAALTYFSSRTNRNRKLVIDRLVLLVNLRFKFKLPLKLSEFWFIEKVERNFSPSWKFMAPFWFKIVI